MPRKATRKEFKFVDLFAGIGGTRLGFESAGGDCVFTAEWDRFARQTYEANFKDSGSHTFETDITKVASEDVPDHDVLLAGFPCQPFSLAGVSKKNSLGRSHGFLDETQGTLFFDIARILETKRPAAFMLENVKNLRGHDGGRTFRVIMDTLEALGYVVSAQVIDGRYWVPQHRERIIIVGFDSRTIPRSDPFDFGGVVIPSEGPILGTVLHSAKELPEPPFTLTSRATVNPKYTLSDKLWTYLQNYAEKHRASGNGFGYGIVDRSSVARTLSARYHKDGSEILVRQRSNMNPRRLTPRECARLMGFTREGAQLSREWVIPVSDTQAYRQFGNSVIVPMVSEVAKAMADQLLI